MQVVGECQFRDGLFTGCSTRRGRLYERVERNSLLSLSSTSAIIVVVVIPILVQVHHFVWIKRLVGVVGVTNRGWHRYRSNVHLSGSTIGITLSVLIREQRLLTVFLPVGLTGKPQQRGESNDRQESGCEFHEIALPWETAVH